VMAMSALLTGTQAWQAYAYVSAILLALVPLAGVGALLSCAVIRRRTVAVAGMFLAFYYLPLVLQRDGFMGQVFALPMLIPITVLGACAFAKRRWRLALPVGLGLASIASAYLVYMPVLAMPLALSACLAAAKPAVTKHCKHLLTIAGIAGLMGLITFAGAPQKTTTLVRETLNRKSSMHRMSDTRAGGPNYPMTSTLYLGGFIDDWRMGRSRLGIAPPVFNACSYALMSLGTLGVCVFLIVRWRTWKALYLWPASLTVGALLAWAYWRVPNRYVFFKSMGYVLPLFVTAVFVGWDTHIAAARRRLVRVLLVCFAALWICWHVLSVVVAQMPFRFVTESITGLTDIDRVVPTNEIIRINFGDMYLTPYVFMVMRHRPLCTYQPFGYTPRSYPNDTWTYSLEDHALPGSQPVWSNDVYYLYKRR
ncbi:hypothetical protein GX586_14525, partial [bacterium]|nr:hypothetical protein [bacterium]